MDNDRNKDKEYDQSREDKKKENEDFRESKADSQGVEVSSEVSEETSTDNNDEKPNWIEELSETFNPDGDGDPQKQEVRRPLSRGKKFLIAFGGALLILLIAAGTYAMNFYSDVQEAERILLVEHTFEEDSGVDVDAAFSERTLNIALLGFDRGWNREAYGEYLFRPDMLAIFSIDFDRDEVSVVRIPRDSYVPIYGAGGYHDKINHAYASGYWRGQGEEESHEKGITTVLQTMSNVLGGIPIHYYVSVDMYSVIELVDAIGGVYYEVEEEIIDKHWEIGRVLVPEGPQIMDGKTYLRYLQYRDAQSAQDQGRMDRQMNLLRETFIYLRQEGKITDIPATYRIYKDYVETDLNYTQIAALAYYGLELDISDIDETFQFFTLQGGGQMRDGVYYHVLYDSDRREVIKKVFGVEAESWPPIVLEDSPEYIEEQRQKELEERQGSDDRDKREDIEDREDHEKDEESEDADNGQQQDHDADRADDSDDTSLSAPEIRERVQVPDLEGMTIDEARRKLSEYDLEVGEVTSRHYNFLDEGLIIHSRPFPGSTVRVGSEVEITVSAGPRDEDN